jgi:hypothetical protein
MQGMHGSRLSNHGKEKARARALGQGQGQRLHLLQGVNGECEGMGVGELPLPRLWPRLTGSFGVYLTMLTAQGLLR